MILHTQKVGSFYVPFGPAGLPYNPKMVYTSRKACNAEILAGMPTYRGLGAGVLWAEPIFEFKGLQCRKYYRVLAMGRESRPTIWVHVPHQAPVRLSYNYYMLVAPGDAEVAQRSNPGVFVI